MPESMTPLIILGVVGALFILLLSLLTNNYSLNNIKSKTVGDGSTEPLGGQPRRRSKRRLRTCRLTLRHGARERTCQRCRD